MTTTPTIILRTQSPYFRLFPDGAVPVSSPLPQPTILYTCPEGRVELVYMLDLGVVSEETLDRIVRTMSREMGADIHEVRGQIMTYGLPIRESQVAIGPAISTRFSI